MEGLLHLPTSGAHQVTRRTPVAQDGEVPKGHPHLAGSRVVPGLHVREAVYGGLLQYHKEAWCTPRGHPTTVEQEGEGAPVVGRTQARACRARAGNGRHT